MKNIQSQPTAELPAFFGVNPQTVGHPFFSHLLRFELTRKLKKFFHARGAGLSTTVSRGVGRLEGAQGRGGVRHGEPDYEARQTNLSAQQLASVVPHRAEQVAERLRSDVGGDSTSAKRLCRWRDRRGHRLRNRTGGHGDPAANGFDKIRTVTVALLQQYRSRIPDRIRSETAKSDLISSRTVRRIDSGCLASERQTI